ncbi:recombinase family protein [Selenomonas felix]|uniref:recombinase family protein n=1 Tax=Selenomonas felix TaxID=1944634 RepID=UPI002354B87E|nr:recombinase family protein [Selenomonas felix]
MKITRIEPTVATLTPKKKVAAYARVSMESDRLNHSLSAQVSYYSNLIQKNPEWIYVGVYADSGISGGNIRRRAEFKHLVEDCDAGKIDIILCKSISRFARNTVDLLETVRHLKSLGIDVWFEKENIKSLSADGELMLGILAGFAEEESRSQSDNAKWSIQKKFERGEQWHTAAYGYRWDGKSFVICEEEANAIRVIYDNFLRDVPLRQTSRWLAEHGYTCSTFFIRYVLQNMVYAGDVLLQRYITENPRTHRIIENKGQLPRYYITDNHPAIIDRATFEKVQEKIRASYEFNPAAHRIVKPSCFSAKIICGRCGAHFVKGVTRTNGYDGLQEHWFCYDKIRKRTCKARNIRGYRLREASCEVLGLSEFDEDVFARTVEKIRTTDTDILEFQFYDGTVKTARIHYYNKAEKKHTDPHKKPFGYRWSKNGYVLVPKEAEAVRLIFQYYLDGWQITDISRKLEADGYGSFRGKISRKLIAYTLKSDFYLGVRRIKAQFSESGKEEVIKNDHEPLVTQEIFDAVQVRRQAEYRRWKGRERDAKCDGHPRQHP